MWLYKEIVGKDVRNGSIMKERHQIFVNKDMKGDEVMVNGLKSCIKDVFLQETLIGSHIIIK